VIGTIRRRLSNEVHDLRRPTTRRFAHLPLPLHYLDGDPLPAAVTDRWFESHDAATAALAELLDRDEGEAALAAE